MAWPLGSEPITEHLLISVFSCKKGDQHPCCIVLQDRWDLACKSPGTEQAMQLPSLYSYFPVFLSDFPVLTLTFFTTKIILNHGKGDGHSSPNWPVNSFTFLPGPPKAKGLLRESWPLTHRVFTSSQPFCVHTLETSSFIRIGPTWGFPLDFTIIFFFYLKGSI